QDGPDRQAARSHECGARQGALPQGQHPLGCAGRHFLTEWLANLVIINAAPFRDDCPTHSGRCGYAEPLPSLPGGTYLANQSPHTATTKEGSECIGSSARRWPPLSTSRAPQLPTTTR